MLCLLLWCSLHWVSCYSKGIDPQSPCQFQAEEARRQEEDAKMAAAATQAAGKGAAGRQALANGSGRVEAEAASGARGSALRAAPGALEDEKRCWEALRAAEVRFLTFSQGAGTAAPSGHGRNAPPLAQCAYCLPLACLACHQTQRAR